MIALEGNKPLIIAVAGNPNCGKSTLINSIAGSRLSVGNWAGVTVERKEALLERNGRSIRLIDLPGVYGLSPHSQEEIVAQDCLLRERPDAIINVVDSTNLERNLYLTIQLLELETPMVLALNIHDEAEAKGYKIDRETLTRLLGVEALPTVATSGAGLEELIAKAAEVAANPGARRPRILPYGVDVEAAADALVIKIQQTAPDLLKIYPARWLAFKLMEEDPHVAAQVRAGPLAADILEATAHLRKAHGADMEMLMADERYARVAGLTREVLEKPEIPRTEITHLLDAVALSKYTGYPIFFFAMWLVFKLTFDVSAPFIEWIDMVASGPARRWATAALWAISAPDWLVSLITEGIIGGVGFVLSFTPVIFAMMFFITFLEGSGYMARAAFLMDRAMKTMGLHGKSFIPMILGFGCNVPAIYATRTLESPRDRALTALLIPLMSCGARLPVYALFIAVFFPDNSGTVLWSLYLLGIALALAMGTLFKRTLFRGEPPIFIMELPPYRMPAMANLATHTWEKGKHFLVKAGTYILSASVLIWFFLHLPWGVTDKKDSYLGMAGRAAAPALAPLGFGQWEAASALITAVIAKELAVSAMGEIYSGKPEKAEQATPPFTEDIKNIGLSFLTASRDAAQAVAATFGLAGRPPGKGMEAEGLKNSIMLNFTKLSAYSFMAFVLLYMPCLVTSIAFVQEFGSWKWFGVAVAYELSLAWVTAFIIYQGGLALGLGG